MLNQSEKKVLTLLEESCRMPAKQIAKKTGLSPEGVLKIIRRLEEKKVIKKFNAKINYSRMGYGLYPVHLKLTRMNMEVMEKIKEAALRHKSCAWHRFCEGEYDLLLSFKTKSEKDRNDMNEMLLEISENTAEKEISVGLYAFEISKSFLERKSQKIFPTLDHSLKPAELSEKEMKIISILRQNSRETAINISKKAGISARAVSSKIKKLEKAGVISGFKTKINTSALYFQPCIALITLGKCSEKDLAKFTQYCKQKEGIDYLVREMGLYDIELTINVQDINDFYRLMDDIREKFRFIKKITTLIAKE